MKVAKLVLYSVILALNLAVLILSIIELTNQDEQEELLLEE